MIDERCICGDLEPAHTRIHCPVHGLFAGLTREQLRERADAAEAGVQRLDDLCALYLREADRWSEEVRRLTEGLRDLRWYAQYVVDMHPEGETSVDHKSMRRLRRALLSANPPQGDAAEGSSPPTMPCGHPESSVVSADEGTAYCGECASPSDGGGA